MLFEKPYSLNGFLLRSLLFSFMIPTGRGRRSRQQHKRFSCPILIHCLYMADDIPQDQTQTQDTPTVPPTDQPPVETPPAQPTPEQPQTTPTETPTVETPQPAETTSTVSPPVLDIPALHFPFSGNFPVTFSFGAQTNNEEIKKKFQEWGIVGHNGLDFGLSAGNEVFACDSGKVIQSGS